MSDLFLFLEHSMNRKDSPHICCKQIVKVLPIRLTFRFFICKIKSSSESLIHDFTHTIFPLLSL